MKPDYVGMAVEAWFAHRTLLLVLLAGGGVILVPSLFPYLERKRRSQESGTAVSDRQSLDCAFAV